MYDLCVNYENDSVHSQQHIGQGDSKIYVVRIRVLLAQRIPWMMVLSFVQKIKNEKKKVKKSKSDATCNTRPQLCVTNILLMKKLIETR